MSSKVFYNPNELVSYLKNEFGVTYIGKPLDNYELLILQFGGFGVSNESGRLFYRPHSIYCLSSEEDFDDAILNHIRTNLIKIYNDQETDQDYVCIKEADIGKYLAKAENNQPIGWTKVTDGCYYQIYFNDLIDLNVRIKII